MAAQGSPVDRRHAVIEARSGDGTRDTWSGRSLAKHRATSAIRPICSVLYSVSNRWGCANIGPIWMQKLRWPRCS